MSESRQSDRIPPRIIEMSDERWADYLTGFRAGYETDKASAAPPVSGSQQSDRIPRTADQFLDEEYTYVEPRFAAAFRDGWNAHEREIAAPPEPPRPDRYRAIANRALGTLGGIAHDSSVASLRDARRVASRAFDDGWSDVSEADRAASGTAQLHQRPDHTARTWCPQCDGGATAPPPSTIRENW